MGQGISLKSDRKKHDLNHDLTFSAHTINFQCLEYLGYITLVTTQRILKKKNNEINFFVGCMVWHIWAGTELKKKSSLLNKTMCTTCLFYQSKIEQDI